jgi:hypothetical protein
VTDPSLIKVRTELVMETLVGSLDAAARERARGEGGAWLEDMGYHTRTLELERFAPAREPLPWLLGADPDELAAQEPLERPDPGDAPSWRVPGPGGHVRHYLALRAVAGLEGEPLELKRAWMRGFFRHCVEEAAPPPASRS